MKWLVCIVSIIVSVPAFCTDSLEVSPVQESEANASLKDQAKKVSIKEIAHGVGYGAFGGASLLFIGYLLKLVYDCPKYYDYQTPARTAWLVKFPNTPDDDAVLLEMLSEWARKEQKYIVTTRFLALSFSAALAYFNYEKEVFQNFVKPFKKMFKG